MSFAIQQSAFNARNKAIEEVLQQNYPGFTIQRVGQQPFTNTKEKHLSWWVEEVDPERMTALFHPSSAYRSFILEVAKVYHFLDERQHLAKSLYPVSQRCPTWRHELRRQGSTTLDAQGNWQSIDTQSYHALHSNQWIGCYYREYPMGWGWVPGQVDSVPSEIEYAENLPDNFSKEDFWRWVNRVTKWNIFGGMRNPFANSLAIKDRSRWEGGGLPPYVDIVNAERKSSLKFILSVQQAKVHGHTLLQKAAAETFFERPTSRRDRHLEKANLWHPYWQAKLSFLDKF